MKKQTNKKPVVLVIDDILDCIPAEIADVEAYLNELELEVSPKAA
ncbi:MAG: hypothetical protein ACK417_02225 [Bacteroidia bacterium]